MDNLLYCPNLNFLILKNKYHTIPNSSPDSCNHDIRARPERYRGKEGGCSRKEGGCSRKEGGCSDHCACDVNSERTLHIQEV